MRTIQIACVLCLAVVHAATSQAQSGVPTINVPRVVSVSGTFRPADGHTPAPVETVRLALYADEVGGTPLWEETQTIRVNGDGQYHLLLGQTLSDGVPIEVFASGAARWLAMRWDRPGEIEGPRTKITSVPYALRASDADTLGGKPASAYLLAPTSDGSSTTAGTKATTGATASSTSVSAAIINPGFPSAVVKYAANGVDVTGSTMYEAAGRVGVGTFGQPIFDFMHVRFNSLGSGALTGYAVQNLNATGYSGMLFYDQNNQLGQFQGFNNATHEYRINNIASGGSINFMLGSVPRFTLTQTKTVIAGIRGITTGVADAVPVVIDSTGQLGTISSSRRFKEDIRDMGDASRAIFALRPVTFRYTQAYTDGAKPLQYGLVAEEVAEVFPALAVHNGDGGVDTVHYETLSVLLLNEVQQQQRLLEAQRAEIELLKARLSGLESQRR